MTITPCKGRIRPRDAAPRPSRPDGNAGLPRSAGGVSAACMAPGVVTRRAQRIRDGSMGEGRLMSFWRGGSARNSRALIRSLKGASVSSRVSLERTLRRHTGSSRCICNTRKSALRGRSSTMQRMTARSPDLQNATLQQMSAFAVSGGNYCCSTLQSNELCPA